MRFWGIIVLVLLSIKLSAQSSTNNLSGVWRGYFTVGLGANTEKYNFELQIVTSQKDKIEGVAYSYRNKSFFGKTSISGTILPNKKIKIKEGKLLALQDANSSDMSLMDFTLENYKLEGKCILEGSFTSYNPSKKIIGTSGQVKLEKKSKSVFYEEDFLTNPKKAKELAHK